MGEAFKSIAEQIEEAIRNGNQEIVAEIEKMLEDLRNGQK